MTLSRIWSAFIIIAIVTAGLLAVFSVSHKAIFSNMVTGKSGDTIKIKIVSIAEAMKGTEKIGQADSPFSNDEKVINIGVDQQMTYRIQSSDGILETCQTAVTL